MAKDIQKSTEGFYKKGISKVGVRNLMIPFTLEKKDSKETFNTIAKVSSYCSLEEGTKGVHMSRIARSINAVLSKNPSFSGLSMFVEELQKSQGAKDTYIKAEFPYIFETKTPSTGIPSLEPFTVKLESVLKEGKIRNYITVNTVEMSLCPCSKEMSMLINNLNEQELSDLKGISNKSLVDKIYKAGFGAHNQKSRIEITVETVPGKRVWLEDLVAVAKNASSCPTWSTLKRPDEKYVTEVSYMSGYFNEEKEFVEVPGAGAKFVEDISRDVAKQLDALLDNSINDYAVCVRNEESIHTGELEAVAVLRAGRELL